MNKQPIKLLVQIEAVAGEGEMFIVTFPDQWRRPVVAYSSYGVQAAVAEALQECVQMNTALTPTAGEQATAPPPSPAAPDNEIPFKISCDDQIPF